MAKKYSYLVSKNFVRKWSKFDLKTKKEIIKRIDVFLDDPFSPPLKTHKLSGKLKEYWSFSVNYNLRIMFRFGTNNVIEFIDIGTHEIYK